MIRPFRSILAARTPLAAVAAVLAMGGTAEPPAEPKKVPFSALGHAEIRMGFTGAIEVTGETKTLVYRQPLPADDDGQDILSVGVDPSPGLSHEVVENGEGRTLVLTWTDPPAGTLSYDVEILVEREVFSVLIDDPSRGEADDLLVPGVLTKPSAAVKKQAKALAAGAGTDLEVVTRIAAWVNRNIEYDPAYSQDKADKSVGKVMEARRGTCDELSHLLISMARVAGIPAREVSGLAFTGAAWGFHSWSEVRLGSRWVPVDPTNLQVGWVDATHVAFARDGDDAKFVQSVESVSTGKFDVVSHRMEVRIMKASTAKGKIASTISYDPPSVPPGQPFTATLVVENPTLSWIAGPARIVVPPGFQLEGDEVEIFVLQPHAKKEISWKVIAKPDADPGVSYFYRMGAVTSPQSVASAEMTIASGLISAVDALLATDGAVVASVTLENRLGIPSPADVTACAYSSWELTGDPACKTIELGEIPAGGKQVVEIETGLEVKGDFAIVVKATLGPLVDERVQKITVTPPG